MHHTRIGCWAAVWLAAALGLIGFPSVSQARERVVLLVDHAQRFAAERVVHALRGQFSDLDVTLQIRSIDGMDTTTARPGVDRARALAAELGAKVVFWCDVESAKKVFVYLPPRDSRSERLLVRAVVKKRQQGRFEALALIVRSIITAEADPAASSSSHSAKREPPKSSAPPLVAKKTAEASTVLARLAIEVAYSGDFIADSALLHHGVAGSAALRIYRSWAAFAGCSYLQRSIASNDGTTVEVDRLPVSAGVRLRVPLGSRWFVAPSAAIRMQVTRSSAEARNSGISAKPPATTLLWAIVPMVRGGVILGRFRGFLEIGVAVMLTRERYVVETSSSGRAALLVPWAAQPAMRAGLAVDVW